MVRPCQDSAREMLYPDMSMYGAPLALMQQGISIPDRFWWIRGRRRTKTENNNPQAARAQRKAR
jgi:hypothetical protein